MSLRSDYEVRELDRALELDGEWIELQRLIGTQLIPIKCKCRAAVRNYDAKELVGGITQDMSEVILSPTQIVSSGWPGPDVEIRNASGVVTQAASDQDRRVPRKGDKVIIQNKSRAIDVAKPKYLDDGLVRITLTVLG